MTVILAPLIYQVLDRVSGALKGYLTEDGTATGTPIVVKSPKFAWELNVGPRELQLQVTRNPRKSPLSSRVSRFDLIRIAHPDGRVMGDWKYETGSSGTDDTNKHSYVMRLIPIVSELSDVDFSGNYTNADDSDGLPHLGPQRWSVPITAAIPRTKHCTLGTINDDGTPYDMDYPLWSKVSDTLNKAIDQGGPDWWWMPRRGAGAVIDIMSGPSATIGITWVDHVIREENDVDDSTPMINVQPVSCGNENVITTFNGITFNAQKPITSYKEDTTSAYSTFNIGRRVAQVWNDPSVSTQAGADNLAQQILNRRKVPIVTTTLRLRPEAPLLYPGNKVNYTDAFGTTTLMWVRAVEEIGASRVQTVSLVSQFDIRMRPFRAKGSTINNSFSGNPVIPSPGSGGSGCGGYQPLARTVPGSVSGSMTGAELYPVRLNFTLDSGGNCQIDLRGCFSIKVAPSGTATDCSARLVADLGGGGGWGAGYSMNLRFPSDGQFHPITLLAPSGAPVADGAYQAYLVLNGPAGTYTIDYDIQVWLYAGGGTTSP